MSLDRVFFPEVGKPKCAHTCRALPPIADIPIKHGCKYIPATVVSFSASLPAAVAKTVCGGVRLLHLSGDTLQDLEVNPQEKAPDETRWDPPITPPHLRNTFTQQFLVLVRIKDV